MYLYLQANVPKDSECPCEEALPLRCRKDGDRSNAADGLLDRRDGEPRPLVPALLPAGSAGVAPVPTPASRLRALFVRKSTPRCFEPSRGGKWMVGACSDSQTLPLTLPLSSPSPYVPADTSTPLAFNPAPSPGPDRSLSRFEASASLLMTSASALKLLLMCEPSRNRSPLVPAASCRSLPAKSTRFKYATCARKCKPSFINVDKCASFDMQRKQLSAQRKSAIDRSGANHLWRRRQAGNYVTV